MEPIAAEVLADHRDGPTAPPARARSSASLIGSGGPSAIVRYWIVSGMPVFETRRN